MLYRIPLLLFFAPFSSIFTKECCSNIYYVIERTPFYRYVDM